VWAVVWFMLAPPTMDWDDDNEPTMQSNPPPMGEVDGLYESVPTLVNAPRFDEDAVTRSLSGAELDALLASAGSVR